MASATINGRKVELPDGFLDRPPAEIEADLQALADQLGATANAQSDSDPAFTTALTPTADAATTPVETVQASLGPGPAPVSTRTPTESLQLGVQDVGRGVADFVGLPGDFLNALVNSGVQVANLAGAGIERVTGADIPDIPFANIPGSEDIQRSFGSLVEGAGIPLLDRETQSEEVAGNLARFGTGAAIGSGTTISAALTRVGQQILNGLRGSIVGPTAGALTAPVTAGTAGRLLATDVAGGVGAGAGVSAAQEVAPGPIGEFIGALVGGLGGSATTSLATAPGRAAQTAASRLPSRAPEVQEPGVLPPSRRSVNEAAQFVQQSATDPAGAAQSIDEGTRFFREAGGVAPTPALLADDPGLAIVERSARLQDPRPFIERDIGVRDSASEDVRSARPFNADPAATREAATDIVEQRRAAATARETEAQSAARAAEAEELEVGEDVASFRGEEVRASEDLDTVVVEDTLKPKQREKNKRFEDIDPEGEVVRSAEPLIETARGIKQQFAELPDSLRSKIVPEGLIRDIEKLAPATKKTEVETGVVDAEGKPVTRTETENVGGTGKISFQTLNAMRAPLAEAERVARTEGRSTRADNLKKFRNEITAATERLAGEGSPAGQRAQTALEKFKTEFAPFFAQGKGGEFRKALNADDRARTKTPPTATAERFLRTGKGSKEAAGDLARILEIAPDPAAGRDAVFRYVAADIAKLTLGPNGKVRETALQKWLNNRSGMLSQFPDLKEEIEGLLTDVRAKGAKTSRLKTELDRIGKEVKQEQRDLDKSALALFIDKEPRKAVSALFGADNPGKRVDELLTDLQGNEQAIRGLKASVSDFLEESVSNTSKGGVSAESTNVSFNKLTTFFRKNETALAKVFGDDVRFLRIAAKRLEALTKREIQAAPGSPTVENTGVKGLLQTLANPIEVVARIAKGALVGGSIARKYKLAIEQLPDSSATANRLINRSLFDPEVMKFLLETPVRDVGSRAWNAKLNKLLALGAGARAFNRDEE